MAEGISACSGRSFSPDVLGRILSVLHDEGPTRKTNLAGKTRLNYLTCMKYLEFLKSLGLVELTRTDTDSDGERISITVPGRRFNASLTAYLKGTDGFGAKILESGNELQYGVFDGNQVFGKPTRKFDRTEKSRSRSSLRKIMLVDDEQDILFVCKLSRSEGGSNGDAFSDSVEALRRIYPNIKIMYVSSSEAAEELSVLPGFGKDQMLKKPVSRETLVSTVEGVLEQVVDQADSVSPVVRS